MHLGCIQQSHGLSGMATADVEHGVSKQRLRFVKRMVIVGYHWLSRPVQVLALPLLTIFSIMFVYFGTLLPCDTGYCTGVVTDVDFIDLNALIFEPNKDRAALVRFAKHL